MRKLIMWNLITLDGMFEGAKSWDLDWHQSVWGPELEQLSIEQLRSAGLLVFGRTTYQGMAAYWQTAQGEVAGFMNNLPKLVFSRTLSEAGWNNTRLVKGDPAEEIRKLKQEDGGDLFIFGSADLSVSFMKHDLIDEYRLAVTPIILGHGSPLFRSQERLDLQLIEARSLQSGCVILRYKPRRNP